MKKKNQVNRLRCSCLLLGKIDANRISNVCFFIFMRYHLIFSIRTSSNGTCFPRLYICLRSHKMYRFLSEFGLYHIVQVISSEWFKSSMKCSAQLISLEMSKCISKCPKVLRILFCSHMYVIYACVYAPCALTNRIAWQWNVQKCSMLCGYLRSVTWL